jgi:predicted GNAT family N-acyltransferase
MAHVDVIEWGSPDYREARLLRDRVLRQPLGLSLADEPAEREQAWSHFGIFEGGALIGCVIGVPGERGTIRIRQMVIREAWRGTGLGKQLLLETEKRLWKAGWTTFVLDARAGAVTFYTRLGYREDGRPFVNLGIVHQRMIKTIPRT